jgi:hypothetical protein
MMSAYGAICCWLIVPLTATFWHFRPDRIEFLGFAAVGVIVGLCCTWSCMTNGIQRVRHDLEPNE